MQSLSDQLTAQFYEWEKRGRGWHSFSAPVDLEPPFIPFFSHKVPPSVVIDDGKFPTLLSTLVDWFKGKPEVIPKGDSDVITDYSIDPFLFENLEELKFFSVTLPRGQKVRMQETEQLLLMLSYSTAPISFEIIANFETIRVQWVARVSDAIHLQGQLKAHFPEGMVGEGKDFLEENTRPGHYAYINDFGLREEFMRPLAMTDTFDLDPFTGLFAPLEFLEESDVALIQILFTGAHNRWSESIFRAVTDNKGGAFFENAPEMVSLSKEKIAYPLFAVSMKVMGGSTTLEKAAAISNSLGRAFVRIYDSPSNALIPLNDTHYTFESRYNDVLNRESHRLGMLLNIRELATIVHLPSPSVTSLKLEHTTKRTKRAPKSTEGHDFVLGINDHLGKKKDVTIDIPERLRHTHILGATGTGKSTLLLNLILQDIEQGNGIAVLDPHGDLIDSILSYIPDTRINDVLVIDPADGEFPVGFNILTAHSEIERDILSSDLVASFRRLSMSWGDQMNSVFANAILAFLENPDGGTLSDLRRFLVEKGYREAYLRNVKDSNIVYYWKKEYPLLKSNSVGSILTRLDTFLRPKLIRNMVCQRKSLDFQSLMDSKKIILVKLAQGLIGSENSYLHGTMIVSKIHQTAMARQAQERESRNDFFLYIDEFQNFVTPSMSSILSGGRKYHLSLILAHQDMMQLSKQDSELAASVMANAGTRICFRLGDADAKRFEDGFSYFTAQDLQNLSTGETIARIDRPEYDFSMKVEPVQTSQNSDAVKEHIRSLSRNRYGTQREEVELLLNQNWDESWNVTWTERESDTLTAKENTEIKENTTLSHESKPIILSNNTESNTTEVLIRQKEESEHRYLQMLIKRMAESRGYKALIEQTTPDGLGRVDVSLERNGNTIACEVSIATEIEWEIHNIEKCLNAGYALVVACSNEKKRLDNISKKIEGSFDNLLKSRILIFTPEELFLYLDKEIAKEVSTEKRMKGYRVKVNYEALPEVITDQKKSQILKAIGNSLKKNTKN